MSAAAYCFTHLEGQKNNTLENVDIITYSTDKSFTNRSSLRRAYDKIVKDQAELMTYGNEENRFGDVYHLTDLGYQVGQDLILDFAQINSMRDLVSWQNVQNTNYAKKQDQRRVAYRQKKEDYARSISDRFKGLTNKSGHSIEQKVFRAGKYHESVKLTLDELERIVDQVVADATKEQR